MAPARARWLPRGIRLSDESFRARHRVISGVLLAHVPALAGLGLLRDVGGWALWGQLTVVAVLYAVSRLAARRHVLAASATALGLMISADILVHVGGGLTDLHIWFYVLFSLVALYQSWVPFLLAVAFVAVHHAVMSIHMPMSVFSTVQALDSPVWFALLHAAFMLAQGVFLAYGWKFAEDAERARVSERLAADTERAAQLRTSAELAAERARSAEEAAARATEGEDRSRSLAVGLSELERAGRRLGGDVETAQGVMVRLRGTTADIAAAAEGAMGTAREADSRSRDGAGAVANLGRTMTEIEQISDSISRIAGQTNLLALNATIEAARAGVAGRGFGVVAEEVKQLATETAHATREIQRVVDDVRGDVDQATSALASIQQIVGGVVEAQERITEAVREQGSSTSQAEQAVGGVAAEAARMTSGLAAIVAHA